MSTDIVERLPADLRVEVGLRLLTLDGQGIAYKRDLLARVLDAYEADEVTRLREQRDRLYESLAKVGDQRDAAVKALEKIERWFGEFPPTGRTWDDGSGEPMSYAACFGSNGERDYMRSVAREVLARIRGEKP